MLTSEAYQWDGPALAEIQRLHDQAAHLWQIIDGLTDDRDALAAALAAERAQRAERESVLMDDIRRTADYWIEALAAEGARRAALEVELTILEAAVRRGSEALWRAARGEATDGGG